MSKTLYDIQFHFSFSQCIKIYLNVTADAVLSVPPHKVSSSFFFIIFMHMTQKREPLVVAIIYMHKFAVFYLFLFFALLEFIEINCARFLKQFHSAPI